MRWMWLSVLSVILIQALRAQAVDDPKELLLEVRKKVMLTIDRLPKYMCTETVERSMLRATGTMAGPSCDDVASQKARKGWKLVPTATDRLRLDVMVSSNGAEVFSWVGEDRFEDRSLADLVGRGATSTGAFATFLGSIFGTNSAQFTYNRDARTASSTLAEFGFDVPLDKSHYSIGNKLHRETVAYDGTFVVDTTTATLVRLTIHAEHVPADLDVCEDTTTLDYGEHELNGFKFFLPKSTRFDVTMANGGELDNRTTFSGCHEFRGESTLQFDTSEQSQQQAAAQNAARKIVIPAGLPFTLVFTQPIDTSTAAAGDIVKAKLRNAIRDKSKTILVAKDTPLVGRIIELEKIYGAMGPAARSLRIGIKLEGIEIEGAVLPFAAELNTVDEQQMIAAAGMPRGRRSGLGGANNRLVTRENLGTFDEMGSPQDSAVGYLLYGDVSERFVIRAGVEMTGKTRVADSKGR